MNLFQSIRDSITKFEEFWNAFKRDVRIILEPSQKLPNAKTINGNSDNKNTPKQPISPAAERRQRGENNTNSDHKQISNWDKVERFIRICELFTFIAIGLAMWYARKQANAAEGQIVEMQKDRNLDERAWVTPYPIVTSRDNSNNPIFFTLHVENTGKTPALIINAHIDAATNRYEIESFNTVWPTNATGEVLYQGTETLVNSRVLSPNETYDSGNEKVPLFIFGIVEYSDIIGIHHWVRFCYEDDVKTGAIFVTDFGNDIDNNN